MFPGMETTTSLVPVPEPATEPVLLKTDVLGRVKHTREQREKILDEFERSGVSGCQLHKANRCWTAGRVMGASPGITLRLLGVRRAS